jgi:hypothetical protein
LLRAEATTNWEAPIQLTEAARADLRWWVGQARLWNGDAIPEDAGLGVVEVTADAAGEPHLGWGGWTSSGGVISVAQGRWPLELRASGIFVKELQAVLFALQSFRDILPSGSRLVLRSDNMSTVYYLNTGGGRVPEATDVVRDIWELCVSSAWRLVTARHIPGVLNTRADALSRRFDTSDWRLNPSLFARIGQRFGVRYTFDRFASLNNRQGGATL